MRFRSIMDQMKKTKANIQEKFIKLTIKHHLIATIKILNCSGRSTKITFLTVPSISEEKLLLLNRSFLVKIALCTTLLKSNSNIFFVTPYYYHPDLAQVSSDDSLVKNLTYNPYHNVVYYAINATIQIIKVNKVNKMQDCKIICLCIRDESLVFIF